MRWIELSSSVDSGSVEKVASILGRYGRGGAAVEERESEITGEKSFFVRIYLLYSRSYRHSREQIEEDLLRLPFKVRLIERVLKPEDWFDSVKKHFGILEIGEKFIIKPGWIHRSLPASTRVVIDLDPGAAFGTGLHPTTRLCLARLEKHVSPGMSVLDLGTGSGILSIAAAKLGAASVLALDIDPVAVKAARSNIKTNHVDECVRVRRGTLSLRARREFRNSLDMVLANITARAISDFAAGFFRVLKPGGILITSGIHPEGLDEVLIKMAVVDFKLEALDREGEWYAVVASKN
jgi:ribosomal protein L11 methyltransferase